MLSIIGNIRYFRAVQCEFLASGAPVSEKWLCICMGSLSLKYSCEETLNYAGLALLSSIFDRLNLLLSLLIRFILCLLVALAMLSRKSANGHKAMVIEFKGDF